VETACLACQRWSRHVDWYHELAPSETKEETESLVAKG
jgi:hypothetical protein